MEVDEDIVSTVTYDEYGDIFNLGSEDEEMFGDW